ACSAARARPALRNHLALTIAIFCAGTPSTVASEEVIRRLDLNPRDITSLDYRGAGWPGRFRVRSANGAAASMSYEESWGGTLTKHRQWRCLICPDHTGEFADLSVGDAWYRPVAAGEPGRSLVVVRTARGKAALAAALADGAIEGYELPLDRLPESQPGL